MLRLENTSEHSEGTFLLFCEEEHFHVVFSFHKDVSPLLKFEPLKYWELEIYAPYHPQLLIDIIHLCFTRHTNKQGLGLGLRYVENKDFWL